MRDKLCGLVYYKLWNDCFQGWQWWLDPGDQDAGTTKKTMKIEAKKGLGGARSGSRYGVEVAITIATKNHALRPKVLHRETKGIKFYQAVVVTSELTNRQKIADDRRNNENIIKGKV